ncbi:DUF1127 domain-containing protein [Methylobacterium sp. BTF04]|uniref:DUF1127 domain-containing protein n=1 Tax=Methylobacterium sp. BTF04 TaxID=2708300 RepID=UPI0013D1E653|nr:DUF1127 domain-containing protein [Methylobacterium sp. BTF04]NEU11995.1 DUF1127 domain-containing protein [Methylobacterium sp. BTF04]
MNRTALPAADLTTTAPLFQTLKRFVRSVVAQAAAGLSRQAINRRVLSQLDGMSDRELKDIGLIRQDVADAAQLSPEQDASCLLIARRDERRGSRWRGC